MAQQKIVPCNVVAVYQPYLQRNVDVLGDAFTWYISLIHKPYVAPAEPQVVEEEKDDLSEQEIVFEDDVDYLRSLDPKEWKDQDHYAVLGIKNLRIKATDDIIKRAYRKKVLKHHPDKRKGQGEEIRPDDDYFTCITRAYEILGTPIKRRSYDSVDPEFDDSLPTASEIKQDFYKVFNKYFKLNARWSEKKNVPPLGNANTSRQEVEKFYSFWYNFESWREFSYNDEEEKERGQDREERRWIEKQNKAVRAKKKKEEMARIRSLVDMAYNNDPRIAKFKQEEKDRKLAAKRAKQDAAQARKDEEERLLKEAQLAKDRAEAAERSRIDAIRMEREAQKRALKKERKTFRDLCKSNDYYSTDPNEKIEHMASVEKICEMLKTLELQNLTKEITAKGRKEFIKAAKDVEEKLEAERKALFEPAAPKQATTNGKSSNAVLEWNLDLVQMLIKAVNLFPAGTNQRWEVIANFLNQHAPQNNIKVTAKDVLNKAKSLQNTDFSKNTLKTMANEAAFDSFEKDKKNARVTDDTTISVKTDDAKVQTNGKVPNGVATPIIENVKKTTSTNMQNGIKAPEDKKETSTSTTKPWSKLEQELLEQAIKTYPNTTPDRWDKIAECIPDRNKKECMRRFKELVDMIKAKKQAQQLNGKS